MRCCWQGVIETEICILIGCALFKNNLSTVHQASPQKKEPLGQGLVVAEQKNCWQASAILLQRMGCSHKGILCLDRV
jgi:hypothetical protein